MPAGCLKSSFPFVERRPIIAVLSARTRDAVRQADAVVLALWLGPKQAGIKEIADPLSGKLVIDPSNPISVGADGTISRTLPDGQSAGVVVSGWGHGGDIVGED